MDSAQPPSAQVPVQHSNDDPLEAIIAEKAGVANFQELRISREIGLQGCKIRMLPASFWDLQAARELNLNNNFLDSLPEGIGNLKMMRRLQLDANNLLSFQ